MPALVTSKRNVELTQIAFRDRIVAELSEVRLVAVHANLNADTTANGYLFVQVSALTVLLPPSRDLLHKLMV